MKKNELAESVNFVRCTTQPEGKERCFSIRKFETAILTYPYTWVFRLRGTQTVKM